MVYDPTIKHWEIKDVFCFNEHCLRLNTIKLLNNKYETAIMRCDSGGRIFDAIIYFYNFHQDSNSASQFHKNIKDKIASLMDKIDTNDFEEIIKLINNNISELNKYTRSVPAIYPEDPFGVTYR
jgi:Zn-dependent M32 family carboxypeptidase